MKPPLFDYIRAESLEQALVARAQGNTQVLAGGLSLVPLMKLRLASPAAVVDISRLKELNFIFVRDDEIRIGAASTVASLIADDGLAAVAPGFRLILSHVGSQQIRNRGTFVGSLCHSDPASDSLFLATLYDASLVLVSRRGVRRLHVSDFVTGALTSALEHDEIVTEVMIPTRSAPHRVAYRCYAPRPNDYAICAAAVLQALGNEGRSRHISVVAAGLSELPTRLPEVEELLRSRDVKAIEPEEISEVCRRAYSISGTEEARRYRTGLASSLLSAAIYDIQAPNEKQSV